MGYGPCLDELGLLQGPSQGLWTGAAVSSKTNWGELHFQVHMVLREFSSEGCHVEGLSPFLAFGQILFSVPLVTQS